MTAVADDKLDYTAFQRLSLADARQAAEQLLAMKGKSAPVQHNELSNIMSFYHQEARLLDEERYEEWFATLSDDLFYWMPLTENRYRRDKRPLLDAAHMAFFDDFKADIALRIGRLQSNKVWSEDPPTRHVYIVSNIEAFTTQTDGEIEAHSTFVQYRNRSEHDQAILAGRRRDLLRKRTQGGYQIARRLILVPQSVLLTKNLTVFF
jgi:ethylbenzene dioxygenase subunit beta